jgi:hypothetical protein
VQRLFGVTIPFVELKVGEQKSTAGGETSTHEYVKSEEAKPKGMKKCSSETSARLTNRDAPLKHRRLHDYDAEAVKRTSRKFYDDFVRKLGLEKANLNE